MNTFSIYNAESGIFNGVVIRCNLEHLDINVPDGFGCVLGEHDSLSEKIDTATGKVVDYIPDKPSDNHQWDHNIKRWVYLKTDADVALDVKRQRDLLLLETDWVVSKYTELGETIPNEWKEYRQALRDITSQKGFPRHVEWPVKPS